MSDIVSDAKEWLEWRPPRDGRTHSGDCHRVHVFCLIERLVAEVERHRMTPGERWAAGDCGDAFDYDSRAMAIQGYLARTAPKEA